MLFNTQSFFKKRDVFVKKFLIENFKGQNIILKNSYLGKSKKLKIIPFHSRMSYLIDPQTFIFNDQKILYDS